MVKKIADKILSAPLPSRGVHWAEKLSKEDQKELYIIWKAWQSGETDLPAKVLGERVVDAFPINVTGKHVALWIADKEGVKRLTKLSSKEMR